ncbi:MAG: hypothetical protein ABR588_05120 [Sphingomicrobium sp.]|nr:hypothetical protein [Sphingomonadales bacterium]
MESGQTLISLVADFANLDREATIFAVKPWERHSPAMLVFDELDTTEQLDGYDYFLEVEVAVADFLATPAIQKLSVGAQTDRLIEYATNDC